MGVAALAARHVTRIDDNRQGFVPNSQRESGEPPMPRKPAGRPSLGDWSRRFALTLPGDAAAALEAKIARLVQECTEVLGRSSEGI